MNKYYTVKLIDSGEYDEAVLEFVYHNVNNALDREAKLVELVEASGNTDLSVVIETCYDTFYGKFNDQESIVAPKSYVRVGGSSGDEYITSEDSCSCPSAFYNGPSCKHQGFYKNGLYKYNSVATQEDFDEAITERGRSTRRW